jgi:hypothetical protein
MAIDTGSLSTSLSTKISGGNSSIVALASGATFSGTWEVTDNFTTLVCSLKTDQVGILYLEFSPDGINIDSSIQYVIEASIFESHRIVINQRYFRARIFNASVSAQTFLRLQTIYGNHPIQLVPLNGTVPIDADVTLTKAILYGTDSTSVLSPIAVNNGIMNVNSGLKSGGVFGALNIPTANVSLEAKVGATALSGRKMLMISFENAGIFWGLSSAVTITSGIPAANNSIINFDIDPSSSFKIWLVGSTNNKNVHIVEIP